MVSAVTANILCGLHTLASASLFLPLASHVFVFPFQDEMDADAGLLPLNGNGNAGISSNPRIGAATASPHRTEAASTASQPLASPAQPSASASASQFPAAPSWASPWVAATTAFDGGVGTVYEEKENDDGASDGSGRQHVY